MSLRTEQIRAILLETRALLEKSTGKYFKPTAYRDLFERWHTLRDEARSSSPRGFSGVSARATPTPTPGAEFDGEGYFTRYEFETAERDMAHALAVSEALDRSEPAGTLAPRSAVRDGRRLSVRTIGLVRRQLDRLTRGELHQLLIEAGSDAALATPFRDRMEDPLYRSKNQMLADGFDTAARDGETGDEFVLGVIQAIAHRDLERITAPEAGIEQSLSSDGLALADVLGHERPMGSLEIRAFLEQREFRQTIELHRKAWGRIETDPSGAITAATSCTESVLHSALDELGIDPGGANQLPDLLRQLREQSNLDQLMPFGDRSRRFMRSLASVAHNAYDLAHEAGDRHGGNQRTPQADSEVAYVFVAATEQIIGVVVRGLRSGRLRRV